MAAKVSGLLKSWTPRVLTVRWSRYNPHFMDPDVDKDTYTRPVSELSEEEKAQRELKAVRHVKAATNSANSSVFSDPVVDKFVNMMMEDGKKVLAKDIMCQTLELIKRKQVERYHSAPSGQRESIECNPYTVLHVALENCKPVLGLKSVKKAGNVYQVPVPLKESRRRFLAMDWIITECRDNKHRVVHMPKKLSEELLLAFAKEGKVFKKKVDMHRMAEANRAFVHFRW